MKIGRWNKYESKAIHILEENEDCSRGTTKSLRKKCGYACYFHCQGETKTCFDVLLSKPWLTLLIIWMVVLSFLPVKCTAFELPSLLQIIVPFCAFFSNMKPSSNHLSVHALACRPTFFFFFWTFKEISIGLVIVIWHNS